MQKNTHILNINSLTTTFTVGNDRLTAINNISFTIKKGEVVGLVGESGSGKSVTAYSIMRLLPANGQISSGNITYKNTSLTSLTEKEMRRFRGKEMGLIFQNAQAALNPVFTIGNQLMETIQIHQKMKKKAAYECAINWLKKVGISDPEKRMKQYPHECSLGMCQRIMIALTLSMEPSLLIADEPTASLDVTIQAQILSLLGQLKNELNMSVLMVSHNLGVIAQHCDRVIVMYCGRIVESGPTKELFSDPKHPYTKALLRSIPVANPNHKQIIEPLKGDVPSRINLPEGCPFHPRCPEAKDTCTKDIPPLKQLHQRTYECIH